MPTITQIRNRAAAAAISIAALGAPATAAARFDLEPTPGGAASAVPASVRPAPTAPRPTDTESGFQWGDAGIGAAGAVLLLGGGALVYVAPRRARRGARAV